MTLPKVSPPASSLETKAAGDQRGRYGFGRPAHGGAAEASYHFAPTVAASTAQEFADEVAKDFVERTEVSASAPSANVKTSTSAAGDRGD